MLPRNNEQHEITTKILSNFFWIIEMEIKKELSKPY